MFGGTFGLQAIKCECPRSRDLSFEDETEEGVLARLQHLHHAWWHRVAVLIEPLCRRVRHLHHHQTLTIHIIIQNKPTWVDV